MAAKRFNPSDFLLGLTKLVVGVAISLLVISLAGAATARYFLTQLSSLPERPIYDNDSSSSAKPASPDGTANQAAADTTAEAQPSEAKPASDPKILYKVTVTYGSGLLIRSGPGNDYDSIGGVDYNETIDVLEESGERWLKIRFDGVEGWIRGKGNTERL